MTNLRPCKCGNNSLETAYHEDFIRDHILFSIVCPNCNRIGRRGESREEAIDAWNGRAR